MAVVATSSSPSALLSALVLAPSPNATDLESLLGVEAEAPSAGTFSDYLNSNDPPETMDKSFENSDGRMSFDRVDTTERDEALKQLQNVGQIAVFLAVLQKELQLDPVELKGAIQRIPANTFQSSPEQAITSLSKELHWSQQQQDQAEQIYWKLAASAPFNTYHHLSMKRAVELPITTAEQRQTQLKANIDELSRRFFSPQSNPTPVTQHEMPTRLAASPESYEPPMDSTDTVKMFSFEPRPQNGLQSETVLSNQPQLPTQRQHQDQHQDQHQHQDQDQHRSQSRATQTESKPILISQSSIIEPPVFGEPSLQIPAADEQAFADSYIDPNIQTGASAPKLPPNLMKHGVMEAAHQIPADGVINQISEGVVEGLGNSSDRESITHLLKLAYAAQNSDDDISEDSRQNSSEDHAEKADPARRVDPFFSVKETNLNSDRSGPVKLSHAPTSENKLVNTDQVINHAQVLVQRGGGTMKVQLYPQELGKVDLRVVVKNDQVQLHIQTETDEARRILEKDMPSLRASLDSHKLKLDNTIIEVARPAEQQLNHQRFEEQQQARQMAQDFMEQMRENNHFARQNSAEPPSMKFYNRQQRQDIEPMESRQKTRRHQQSGRNINLVA